jgi:hypothetical protein
VRNLKVGVSFGSSGFNLGSIAQFIESVKALWKEGNIQLG